MARGAFIVLEGLDRSGKSTQVERLVKTLVAAGHSAKAIRFPDLENGTTVVADRYAFSGIAFSAVKGLDYAWCKSPDVGLLKPDRVFFLDLSAEAAEKRGGYGQERYEQKALQEKVRGLFERIGKDHGDGWNVINAERTPDQVAEELGRLALETASSTSENRTGLWQ